MIGPYKVLLINPPYPGKTADPSPSLGYLGSVCKKCGADVQIWDEAVELSYRQKVDELITVIKRIQPDLIGVTLTTPFVRFAYDFVSKISGVSTAHVIAGGAHVTFCPEEVLYSAPFQLAVIGEGEKTMEELLRYYMKKNVGLEDIKGIVYKNASGKIIFNAQRPFIEDLDSLLPPLDQQCLIKTDRGEVFGQILTSRGCPGACTFCGSLVHGKRFRFRSANSVFGEMRYLHEKFGIKRFRFQDDALTINQPRLMELCGLIGKERRFCPSWTCQSRADTTNKTLLKTMKEAGCMMIDIGLESASPRVMEKIKKHIAIGKVLEAIDNCYDIGLPVTVNLMTGFPFETKEDIRCNIDFMKSVSKKVSRFNVGLLLKPYPGTDVYKEYHDVYGFTQWWLDERYCDKAVSDYRPFYLGDRLGAWTMPEDATMEFDFFKYSDSTKKEIKKFIWYKCWFSMKKCHGIMRSMAMLSMFYISKLLYKTNPVLERTFMPFLFRTGQKANYLYESILRPKRKNKHGR